MRERERVALLDGTLRVGPEPRGGWRVEVVLSARPASIPNQGGGRAMTERLRVLIVDDQRLLCEGFRELLELEPDLEVVGIAADGEEALDMVERLSSEHSAPHVVLMDVRMPRLDGIAATRALIERWPEIRVIILTTFDDRGPIQAGLQAGAQGYVLKDITAEQLAMTIRVVAQGQVLLHPDVAHQILTSFSPPPVELAVSSPVTSGFGRVSELSPLTEREREVLALLARGASNREIGEVLYIASGTVKRHLSNILGKPMVAMSIAAACGPIPGIRLLVSL